VATEPENAETEQAPKVEARSGFPGGPPRQMWLFEDDGPCTAPVVIP
jgi:hypothetical protein